MAATRTIDGVEYSCAKVPGERGVDLFFRVSSALSGAQGLFEAIAAGDDEATLIRAFFAFSREMKQDELKPLIMELASLPKPIGQPVNVNEMYLEDLLRLAFFAVGVNFSTFLPAGLEEAFIGPEVSPELSA